MQKVIIFDYDGTLLTNDQTTISEKTKSILRELKTRNNLIILATGRPLNHCEYLFKENLVDYIVSANGSLVSSNDSILFSKEILSTNVSLFHDFCIKYNIPSTFYKKDILTNGIINNHIKDGLKEAMNINAEQLSIVTTDNFNNVYLMCAFATDDIDQLLKQNFPNLYLSRWHTHIISLLDVEVTKTTGILKILEYHNIPTSQCIAVGDGGNDVDMLKMAGYGVAVGTNESLVPIADMVITSVEEQFLTLIEKW